MDRGADSAVRCVRGDRLIYDEAVKKDEDGIFSDPKTGFQWAKPEGPESMEVAKARCENLIFGNNNDWRLPNISELHTIMPSTKPEGYIYSKHFLLKNVVGDETVGPYMSSTTLRESDGKLKARYIGNYWNYTGWWNGENNIIGELGKDVQNDHEIDLTNTDSIYSYCVRGGYL